MLWLRHPKTTQEIRENSIPENKNFVRGKRSKKHLPTTYDDIFIDQVGKKHKSWKNIRKTQYKVKNMTIYKYVCYYILTKQEFFYSIKFLYEIDFYKFLDECNRIGMGKWQYWRI